MLRQSSRTHSTYRVFFTMLGCLALVPLASCNLISPLCGTHFINTADRSITSFAAFDTGVLNGVRFYERSLEITNVCPDEHVTSTFSARMEDSLQLPMTVRGYIFYSLLFPNEETVLWQNASQGGFKSDSVEVGLKQQFGEDPANFFVVLRFEFPTSGVEAQDFAYFSSVVDEWEIRTSYFAFPGS